MHDDGHGEAVGIGVEVAPQAHDNSILKWTLVLFVCLLFVQVTATFVYKQLLGHSITNRFPFNVLVVIKVLTNASMHVE